MLVTGLAKKCMQVCILQSQESSSYEVIESLFSAPQVDLDEPDAEASSSIRDLPVLDCILEAGQMLFIPPGWWHYVKSLSVSFSVSFWWK